MIKNFDVIKVQLRELAGVINTFKSEAVQLRLIELVFETVGAFPDNNFDSANDTPSPRKRRKKKSGLPNETPTLKKNSSVGKARAGRLGGKAMLDRLLGEGFFKKPKTINQLVEHCDHNLALKYKQSDFSGALGRLTRNSKLHRTKNADKQYEYSEV